MVNQLPHMLFYGPPGTGKTSTILALAKELYGPEMFKSRVLELNASDERGISIVREKVKDFARMQLSNPPPNYKDRYPCPPFKIIVLDEADSMTQDAQSALRRTMETYSKITRFCLICNYVTRIIDPLASRCSKFRFKTLDEGNARKRIEDIAGKENVQVESGAIDALIKCSEGDLRKAITFLQSASKLVGGTGNGGESKGQRKKKDQNPEDAMDIDDSSQPIVTSRTIEEIAGVVPTDVIRSLIESMQPKAKGVVYESVATKVNDLIADGWSAAQLIAQVCLIVLRISASANDLKLYQEISHDDSIHNLAKGQIMVQFSDVDKRLVDGADEHLAVLDLTLQVSRILAESQKV